MIRAKKLPIMCKIGFHTDVVFYVKGIKSRIYTRHEPWLWDGVKCYRCNNDLGRTKKMQYRQAQIDAEVIKIRREIKEYGHPLITGITL